MSDIQQGRGVVSADFDSDGDGDIFMTNRGSANSGVLWQNEEVNRRNNSLTVRLTGLPPNTPAANARITVSVGGRTLLREVTIGNNFTSQNPSDQIFGLGTAASTDSVTIEWPSGATQTFQNVGAGLATYQEQ